MGVVNVRPRHQLPKNCKSYALWSNYPHTQAAVAIALTEETTALKP
jgi:hypothetical protein